MEDPQSQLVAKLKESKNVLVTVSKDPSVDQLAAAIGLTIALNRLEKHATAVYSGATPSTIEFLRPEATLEKTTDSLRDFIIALDKSKADKLRYKVEDEVVRIFITPYHTAISEKDLDFSQGDFNVDLVVALGVTTQQDLDEAVQAHGRILHDATVASLSTGDALELGSINWVQPDASALSEMVLALIEQLDHSMLDGQVATALLTGIVAMTERFSNDRTTPRTMSASATLMAAGANQQLITTELETSETPPSPEEAESETAAEFDGEAEEHPDEPHREPAEPGTLEIMHEEPADETTELPAPADEQFVPNFDPELEMPVVPSQPQIHVDDDGHLRVLNPDDPSEDEMPLPRPELRHAERITEPPAFDEQLSANTELETYSPPTEELVKPKQDTPILSHNEQVLTPVNDGSATDLSSPDPAPETHEKDGNKTLSDIEQEVNSPHLHSAESESAPTTDLAAARDAVEAAQMASPSSAPEPVVALNAQPLGDQLHYEALEDEPSAPSMPPFEPVSTPSSVSEEAAAPSSPSAFPGTPVIDPEEAGKPAPPPVPPPPIFPSA